MSKQDKRSTEKKCREILAAIVNKCNEEGEKGTGYVIGFGADWGGNSLTLYDKTLGHTHVGGIHEGATFEQLIDDLHGQLIHGRGLSYA